MQETRHFHEDTGSTSPGREKSDAEDYRYFPEPDLAPVAPSREWVEELRATLPEPPVERRRRLQAEWGFSDLEMRDTVGAGALDLVAATIEAGATPAAARKWWLSELARRANEAERRAGRAGHHPRRTWRGSRRWSTTARSTTSSRARSSTACWPARATPDEVVAARGLAIVSDDGALTEAVDRAIAANPGVADKIRDGKVAAAGALIGAVMKEMRGQADAGRVRELILARLT